MLDVLDQFFVYHPAAWTEGPWAASSRLPLEEVWFKAEDGTVLFGWYVQGQPEAPTLLWCHGNAGNITHRLENLALLHRLGLSVFVFDYRGYGRSDGRPSEPGLYQDAQAAYGYVTHVRGVRPTRLVIFGRSLGAAVAGWLASQFPAAGLILEGPFPSIEAMARFYYLGLPVHWFLDARYPLIEYVRRIKLPLLVIHGNHDTVVPIDMGRQVYEAAPQPKEWYVVEGGDHNDAYVVGGRGYAQTVARFAFGR
jgi:pimeloyl-ACP methyl ester carboxylesterase